jgi:5-methylcytosine-specific restriction protein B
LTPGNTPSWGTALGQERPDYPISVDGGEELVELIVRNQIEFNPITNNKQSANIKNIEKKKILKAGRFESVIVNGTEIKQPFFLLIVEETSGEHVGRKSLKYNNKIGENGITNELFYQKIQEYLGNESCWFAHKMFVTENRLNISVIKVSDKPVVYNDSGERKKQWEALVNDFADIKESFKFYCLNIREIKNPKTVSEYIRTMPKIKNWFINHNLCESDFKIWDILADISYINNSLAGELSDQWKEAAKKNDEGDFGFMMATWNRWNEFRTWYFRNIAKEISGTDRIDFYEIHKIFLSGGLNYNPHLIGRFIGSLMAKPFLILTGLSGSGKTKLAQAFTQWICQSKEQFEIIPVGADWTNREPLLGYPNSLVSNHYVKPDSGALDILMRAHKDFQQNNENLACCKPYFLILDEMNLSHVERYFADFLSAMESADSIKLYSGSERYADFGNEQKPVASSLIPDKINWPKNLFIIGTVNIDETTYMFSPKVLDRANTIEFRISIDEMNAYFKKFAPLNMNLLMEDVETKKGRGAGSSKEFMRLAARDGIAIDPKEHQITFIKFFSELQTAGIEFGYRTANEMSGLMAYLAHFNVQINDAYDIAIMQKLLPKLHGSRSKLNKVIPSLLALCEQDGKVIYPISYEKLNRMKKNADENGFASYAEA